MKVTIEYAGQVRRYAGTDREDRDCEAGTTVAGLLRTRADEADDALRRFLVDDAGDLRASLMVAVNGSHLVAGEDRPLAEGDVVLLLSPVAGG